MEHTFICPLLNRGIEEAECYDIQLGLEGYIKPCCFKVPLTTKKAKAVCGHCEFNQLFPPAERKQGSGVMNKMNDLTLKPFEVYKKRF